jgi:hypothetical protein
MPRPRQLVERIKEELCLWELAHAGGSAPASRVERVGLGRAGGVSVWVRVWATCVVCNQGWLSCMLLFYKSMVCPWHAPQKKSFTIWIRYIDIWLLEIVLSASFFGKPFVYEAQNGEWRHAKML